MKKAAKLIVKAGRVERKLTKLRKQALQELQKCGPVLENEALEKIDSLLCEAASRRIDVDALAVVEMRLEWFLDKQTRKIQAAIEELGLEGGRHD